MSTIKYIRAMSFWETVGTMHQLYFKMIFPIIILNIAVFAFTLGVGVLSGAFVGPVLMMTSNVILERPVNFWQSVKRGLSPGLFFKTAIVSLVYAAILLLPVGALDGYFAGLSRSLSDNEVAYFFFVTVIGSFLLPIGFLFIYLLLLPIWVFIPMIMLLEKNGLRSSIKRSFQILSKNFRRTLQVDIFITVVFTVLASITVLASGFNLADVGGDILWEIIYFVVSIACITGINSFPYVFVYYEYRARYEGYSEELLAQEMGYQPMEEMMSV